MNDSSGSPAPPHTLPRVLNWFDATTVVVGSIIGSGVFLKASVVAKELGATGPMLAIWIGVGVLTLCGALALAELAAMLPQAGGPFVYLREAYGRLPAFLWGWTEFWIIRTGSIGALACATTIYLGAIVPLSPGWQEAITTLIVVGLAVLNIVGTRWGAAAQNLTTVIKLGFLAVLILGPWLLGKADVENLQPVWPSGIDGSYWKAIGAAMIAVMWPYDGWINLTPVAEEIDRPQRNLPLALGLGMLIVILVYTGANLGYHLVLPMAAVRGSERVAADASYVLFGDWGRKLAAAGVMCSTFGAVNANMLVGPRIYFAMARDGLMPKAICKVHPKFFTPANAIALQAAWTVVLLFLAHRYPAEGVTLAQRAYFVFDALTNMVIFGGSVFYAMAVAAVFVLRARHPEWERPYRTWGYPVTPILYLLMFAAALTALFVNTWERSWLGALLIASGVPVYFWWTRRELA
ncbi:MAG: amino acid permease [Planctomycetia bacterium]|nr:amino acid permease [Planctomycetia bacterium]